MTDTDTYADLIAAEDVLLFVHAAITATGQREFHSEAYQQQLSLDFLHEYVRVNYRKVYAASLALDINDHNAARIVQGLLETAAEATAEERRTEGRLIAARAGRRGAAGVADPDGSGPAHGCGPCEPCIRSGRFRRAAARAERADGRYP